MVKVYSFNGLVPVVHPEAFVHPSAVLIGDVHIGPRCYIGPCASLRGDFGRLTVKAGSNLQDSCVMHGGAKTDTVIEENGHIGHGAIIHGCHIRKGVLIGMNSVIMDAADIGESSIVAANTFVKTGMKVPPRSMVAGNPGKVMRELTEKEITNRVRANLGYQKLAMRSLIAMQETVALTEAEPGRQRKQVDGTVLADAAFDEMVLAYRASRGL
jgi:phenylacetic acid degradation protein